MVTACRSGRLLARLLLGCAGGLAAAGALAAADRVGDVASPQVWLENPFRRFGSPQTLVAGRAVLIDEAEDPGLRSALAGELRRLFGDLYGKQGWRVPFADDGPLRIYVARRYAEPVKGIAAVSMQKGKLVAPAILLDGAGRTTAQIVREVARRVALATLLGYGGPEDAFLATAIAEVLAGADGEAKDEAIWILAAAPLLDLRAQPETLGRLWVEEIVRATGIGFLRVVWERAADTEEAPMAILARMFSEMTGESQQAVLVRCAARLYASFEPEAAPSRLRLFDLEAGVLDAAPPAFLTVRHWTFLPEGSEEALRISWPADGGRGAAVVRYSDAALPPDVVFLTAGDLRTVPLSGVARIDWLVAGTDTPVQGLRAPVDFARSATVPFTGLDPHASAGDEGLRLWWSTATHEGLWGWAIFREEVLPDGRIARAGPGLVPSSERGEEPFGYVFVDSASTPGTFYRYTVWGVTDEGLLARAFSVTLKTAD